jgi:hypothetical protein
MKLLVFNVQIRAEFFDHKEISAKKAAHLLCQDINTILAKYAGSTGGAQIIDGPQRLRVTGRPASNSSKTVQPRRRCERCGQLERVRVIGGIRYSNMAFGLCAKCLNATLKS